jgi:hypothetical protein
MFLNLTDQEIQGLIAYARNKFAAESYPFAPALRPIREALAKLDPKPVPQPHAEEALCAEPSAGQEEQAAALSPRLGIRL